MSAAVRVLVVDDSAFARKVVREVLTSDRRIEVVGIARDGLDAIEKISALDPDVVTLDLVMPELDGLGVLQTLRERDAAPRVIVVTMSDLDSGPGVAALALGAFDVVHKPTALATDRLYELRDELVEKVLAAAGAPVHVMRSPKLDAAALMPASMPDLDSTRVLVIGASTGGPRAITLLLRALPKEMPIPIAVVVHMPAGYTEPFAARLDADVGLRVVEAADGVPLVAGTAVVARAGMHLRLEGGATRLDVRPLDLLHRPAVDELFKSAAASYGPAVLGVVLTGMGADGLEGARAVREAGGRIVVESAETCVVYGMPRAVSEAGLADAEVPLDRMAQTILRML